jgi:hypothetical protein
MKNYMYVCLTGLAWLGEAIDLSHLTVAGELLVWVQGIVVGTPRHPAVFPCTDAYVGRFTSTLFSGACMKG